MNDEKSIGDLVMERVKPREFFTYPEYCEETEITEIIRRSCEKANEMRKHFGTYLQIEEMLKDNVPPVIINVLLGGFVNVFEWVFSVIGMGITVVYSSVMLALYFLAFTIRARRTGFYLWLYSEFPQNLLILFGIPLLLLFLIGIMVTIKNDLETFVEARKATTVERAEWEREMDKEAKATNTLYNEISKMFEIGGIPAGYWHECDRIWGYIKDRRADSLSEALRLLEADQKSERFGKDESMKERLLEVTYLRAEFIGKGKN